MAAAGGAMTVAELVRRLAAAGASPEVIAIAVEAVEARDRADAGAGARIVERSRRYRERGGGNIPDDLRQAVYRRD